MESDKQTSERETPPQYWRSCKLIIDPALTKGLYKVYRYDGQCFNIPVEDLGLFPVETVRDPRICRLWSKCNKTDLSVPKFKVDEWYVGPVPPKQVTFSRLNDNVREAFLTNMCSKYGNTEEVEIFYNPKNKKHLGVARVVFDTVGAAKEAVRHLHQTSVMGNIIHVEIDPKGENRARYLQLLLHGLYTPWTLPVGSSERALQGLIDSFLGGTAMQRQMSVSSPTSIATPLSLDTAYSSIWQDTPGSFGLTPRSQGTPRTPLSLDSCYSSLQATPVLQGEPSTHSLHKLLRRELYHRKHRKSSDVSLILKHYQSQPPLAPSNQIQAINQQLALWGHGAQSSTHNDTEPSFDLASPCEESIDLGTATSETLSFSILSINLTADQQTAASPPSAGICSSSSPQPEAESLDSRIESLLINSRSTDPSCFDRQTLEADEHSQDSPASPCAVSDSPSLDGTLMSCGPLTSSHQPPYDDTLHVGPASHVENEEDETAQAVLFLTRSSQSPSDFTQFERRAHINNENDAGRFPSSSCPKEHHTGNGDEEPSNNRQYEALTLTKDISSLQPPPFSPQHLIPKAPPAVTAGGHPPVTAFPFPPPPFPPPAPPVPPRLPNGIIPIPPPGWIPSLGYSSSVPVPPPIPPPPSIPPPPTFLGPPPPLMAPPSVPPPPGHGRAPLQFPRPPWPAPPFPRFNPFVPPPDYTLVREDPHKVTVEKVVEVLMDELKSIVKKDITRRMIEGVAFKAFEEWWDCQEKKTKIQVSPLKSGLANVEGTNKHINPLRHVSGQSKKPPLPSFKVKRKRADDPAASNEMESALSSTHENSDAKQGGDTVRPGWERPKRRHARPHELDSEDDDAEGKEVDHPTQDEEMTPHKAEAAVSDNDTPQNLSDGIRDHSQTRDGNDDDNDDEDDSNLEENKVAQKHTEDEVSVTSHTSDGEQCSGSETFSESSSYSRNEYSSDSDSSDSFSSESSEESSYSNLSLEDEDMEEGDEDNRSDGCIVISDEESMELDPPLNSAAPLTPGAQLDLFLLDWSESFQREGGEENQHTSCQRDTCDLATLMELQTSETQDLQPPSPLGLAAVEPDLDVEMESPEWMMESLETVENLRPLTPTGCLVDSDPDPPIKSKPTSPTEEVERPQTPGKGIVAELEIEDSDAASEVLSLSPVNSELVLAPSDLPVASYPLYQEIPKTPGREERSGCTQYSSGRAPATPGREIMVLEGNTMICPPLSSPTLIPSLSSNPYIPAPKTPGRDIILPRRTVVHRRKTQMLSSSLPALCADFLGGSPITVSSPCSPSECSSDSADGGCVWISSRVRVKPLQGLENMPGLLDEEKSLFRREQWRRLKRRWRSHRHRHRSLKRISGSLSCHSRPRRWRSLCEERRILHRVWREGLDEEDARLLQCTYEKLQEQYNGCGWLSDTLWIPHPLTKVPAEKIEEHKSWLPTHRTGSARSEGYYKLSRKDKMKYLNNTRPATESPSTSAQGISIPAQQPTSLLRAGSDFRAEQRRLLSSFSCDSDLVKFNQLKFRKKRICFSRSHIHDWGLFAMEPIAADEMVIEYVGQIIRQVIADMRERRYEEEGIGSSYLFRVDQDTIIDATKCGNLARFINHSCNPNCYAKIITVESQKKIVIYSRQPISINEEITYDYKFPIEETKIPCLCGADSCRGSLN